MSRTKPTQRTATQKAADRAAIADRYLRGELQSVIAAALGIDQSTVSRDLKAVQAEWLTRSVAQVDARKAEELARLDALEREYRAAWEASQQPITRSTQHVIRDAAGKPTPNRATTTSVSARDGNPAYLAGVLACIDRRCKLLGIDAPQRVDVRVLAQQEAERLAAATGQNADDILAEFNALVKAGG